MWGSEEKRPRRRPVILEEEFNREGHWYRDFSVRGESWPIIEHWASEHGFHLVALKGKRRLYYRGYNANTYVEFVEIRHEENRIVLSGWVAVGNLLRWLSLFWLPAELPVYPRGIKGIRVRRRLCHDLNALLSRLRQPSILESHGFHWADLDMSTLILMALFSLSLLGSFIALFSHMDVAPSLSSDLIEVLTKRAGVLFLVAFCLGILHHFALLRNVTRSWVKYTSSALLSLGFAALTILMLTHTSTEVIERKFSYYCLVHYEASPCAEAMASLGPEGRKKLQERLELVRGQLGTPVIPYQPR